MSSTPTTPWLSTEEAAAYLNYASCQGVRDAVARGDLRAYRRGRRIFVHVDDADAFMRRKSAGPNTDLNVYEEEGHGEAMEQFEEDEVRGSSGGRKRPLRSPGPRKTRANGKDNGENSDHGGGNQHRGGASGAGKASAGRTKGHAAGTGAGGDNDPFGLREALAGAKARRGPEGAHD